MEDRWWLRHDLDPLRMDDWPWSRKHYLQQVLVAEDQVRAEQAVAEAEEREYQAHKDQIQAEHDRKIAEMRGHR